MINAKQAFAGITQWPRPWNDQCESKQVQFIANFYTNQSLVLLENLADGAMKDEALEFLKDDKLHQCLRNEIQYGLIPKTAKEGNHWHHKMSV